MLDRPFRVCRTTRTTNGQTVVSTFSIERSGEDTICYCDDVTYAYRIVELLNAEDEHAERTSPSDRRVHQGRLI